MTGLKRGLVKRLHRFLSFAFTSRGKVCVYGWPDYEENTLSAAVQLARTGVLRVTLLVENPEFARRCLALVNDLAAPIKVVSKASLRGLLEASAAEALLFSHGLYGSPDFKGRKLVINLWHGYGPKANDNALFSARIPFDVMTCDTPVWARAAARWLGVPQARLLVTGNPRQLAMKRPPDPAALARLGLRSSGFILWMPTYRATNGASGGGWRDAPDLSEGAPRGEAADPVSQIARLAEAAGVELVVKPHPLDAGRYGKRGLRVITTEEIFRSGMTMYQLIGASAAMISDYSSVWVEYLAVDRPLALYCPDIDEYVKGRGFSDPPMTEIVGDLIVEQAEDIGPFLHAVASQEDWRPGARRAARAALELTAHANGETFASAILSELERHRVSRDRVGTPQEVRPVPAFNVTPTGNRDAGHKSRRGAGR
jgi:hypothetical protein